MQTGWSVWVCIQLVNPDSLHSAVSCWEDFMGVFPTTKSWPHNTAYFTTVTIPQLQYKGSSSLKIILKEDLVQQPLISFDILTSCYFCDCIVMDHIELLMTASLVVSLTLDCMGKHLNRLQSVDGKRAKFWIQQKKKRFVVHGCYKGESYLWHALSLLWHRLLHSLLCWLNQRFCKIFPAALLCAWPEQILAWLSPNLLW